MIKPFFCTGLPRSRTAWLANFLTTDKSLCLHDPKPGTILGRIAQGKHFPPIIGASGPELVTEYAAIYNEYPGAPWLLLVRPENEAFEAFRLTMERNRDHELFKTDQIKMFWAGRATMIEELSEKPHVLVMKWTELDNDRSARQMWRHLLPEIEFQPARWKMLTRLNVQQMLPKSA